MELVVPGNNKLSNHCSDKGSTRFYTLLESLLASSLLFNGGSVTQHDLQIVLCGGLNWRIGCDDRGRRGLLSTGNPLLSHGASWKLSEGFRSGFDLFSSIGIPSIDSKICFPKCFRETCKGSLLPISSKPMC